MQYIVNDPNAGYEKLRYLDTLPAYDLNENIAGMLDLSRAVELSEEYYWLGKPTPTSGLTTIEGRGTLEDHITVDPGSLVMAISGFSSQPQGYQIQLYDEGARQFIFGRTFCKSQLADGAMNGDEPFGPYYLLSPWFVLEPGQIKVQITNLSSNSAIIQSLLALVVPISRRSYNQMITRPVVPKEMFNV